MWNVIADKVPALCEQGNAVLQASQEYLFEHKEGALKFVGDCKDGRLVATAVAVVGARPHLCQHPPKLC